MSKIQFISNLFSFQQEQTSFKKFIFRIHLDDRTKQCKTCLRRKRLCADMVSGVTWVYLDGSVLTASAGRSRQTVKTDVSFTHSSVSCDALLPF